MGYVGLLEFIAGVSALLLEYQFFFLQAGQSLNHISYVNKTLKE